MLKIVVALVYGNGLILFRTAFCDKDYFTLLFFSSEFTAFHLKWKSFFGLFASPVRKSSGLPQKRL